MNTREEVQQAQDIIGPSQVCDRCGINKSLSDFDRFETKWAPKNIHRWCRGCRSTHLSAYDPDLVAHLTTLFLETKRAIDDRDHPNYANWGALGVEDDWYSVDAFIEHVIIDLGYDSVKKLEGLVIDRIYDILIFGIANIQFITQVKDRNAGEQTERKFVSLKRSTPGRKEDQNEEN